MPERDRHVLAGDLEWLEYAIADYVARWGEHFTGKPYLGEFGPNIAGLPTGVANMAMTVIRKNLVAQWTEPAPVSADEDPAPVVAGEPESTPAAEPPESRHGGVVCPRPTHAVLIEGADDPYCGRCGWLIDLHAETTPYPQPEEKLVDLMGALETSVREAKEARKRHPQPLIPVENWTSAEPAGGASADPQEAPRG